MNKIGIQRLVITLMGFDTCQPVDEFWPFFGVDRNCFQAGLPA